MGTTVVYVVRPWPKRRYSARDCVTNEIIDILGFYVAYNGSLLRTPRDNLSVSSPMVKQSSRMVVYYLDSGQPIGLISNGQAVF